MTSPVNEISRPLQLIIPNYTTTIRDTLLAEVGTTIYNTSTSKLNVCVTAAVGAGSWEAVTSA